MANIEYLTKLLSSHSPSGYETASTDVFTYEMEKNGAKFSFRDSIGNCAYTVGLGNIPFMLSAHIDQVGLQVQHVDDKGFVYFIKDGGVDAKTLPGTAVTILTKNGPVNGVIGKTPIHIEWYTDKKDKAIEVKDLKIDIGASSKEEALSMIQIGNPVAINHPTYMLGENRICSGGIDDKIGIYIVTEVMRKLKEDEDDGELLKALCVYGVACTQEEVGGYGASIASKRINPRYSIDYDVTFATDDDCVSSKEWGDIKLGAGGCIAHGPDKNEEMCSDMIDICNKNGIPYQEFSVSAGMTNTCKIKTSAYDCNTLLLSIPERNMHTPTEVCDMRDVESLVEMTYMYIKQLDKKIRKL